MPERSSSRLLHLRRAEKTIRHDRFDHLPELLRKGDLLVRNETRVLPARLIGTKLSGGQVEVLLVRREDAEENVWCCMTRGAKSLRAGTTMTFPGGISARVVEVLDEGVRKIRFAAPGDFLAVLEQVGHMPLPPYIRRDDQLQDKERYQTVFARQPGAVAAPTAGLHFTDDTFAALAQRGVEVCGITLHVGPGTFLPVRTENLLDHRMHAESYEISADSAQQINAARAEGRRVIALGTTVTRTLEHVADDRGRVSAGRGDTDLFLKPGDRFRVVDALITNFHLPKSTLLVLVSAFAGRDFILQAYREAVAQGYRFFSYGDCMLIE